MDVAVRKLTLERLGLVHYGAVHENLPPARLVEAAVRRREGMIAGNGALVAKTGKRTGRSPKDRFIVEDDVTRDKVAWGAVNKPFSTQAFESILEKATDYLGNLEEFYVVDAYAGADPRYRLNVQVAAEYAWHALFARQLFRRPGKEELEDFEPEWTVLGVPGFLAEPEEDGTGSETFVCIDFSRKVVLICGTGYAGEIKKSIFSVLNFVLPTQHHVFPMHCSANVGERDDVACFFGLSGTGKTTLSADPERRLIGDDEHGWSDQGVFNFEGVLRQDHRPLGREGASDLLRHPLRGRTRERRRGATEPRGGLRGQPHNREHPRGLPPGVYRELRPRRQGWPPGGRPLPHRRRLRGPPPISALTPEQAAYYFLSGYTAKLAGTEADMENEVEATFSTCFGAPFLPLPATTYSTMLSEKLKEHGTRCYLINTGWSGGPYGVGDRIDITETRAMVRAVIEGKLDGAETREDPVFGLHVPLEVPGVATEVLDPRGTWDDKSAYDEQAKKLAGLFTENFEKFEAEVNEEVKKAGPASS